MADLSGKHLGGYLLIERIGRGGMSDVYRAQTKPDEAEIALKVLTLDPEQEESAIFLARFEREARIAAELSHAHLLPVMDYGREGNYVYFVTRLISGGTLADRIRQGAIPPQDASLILGQIAAALDHAHDLQVIHRDLKPTNVLLDTNTDAYLTDFGIAWLTSHTSGLTQTGNVVGTPAYMAPEQWRAETLDARTDVYGLGIMAFLMLTTRVPFEAQTVHTMMYQHLDQPAPSLRLYQADLPERIDWVVSRALAKHPNERYNTAGEFSEDFRRAVAGEITLAESALAPTPHRNSVEYPPPASRNTPYPIPAHLRPTARRVKGHWLWAAFGLTVLLVAGMGVLSFFLIRGELFKANEEKPASTHTPIVTLNERPLDVPRVQLVNPRESQVEVAVGDSLLIQATAYDHQGVTRIELREAGTVIQTYNPQVAGSPVTVEFAYQVGQPGQYPLEIVAFRGDLSGESRFLMVVAQ